MTQEHLEELNREIRRKQKTRMVEFCRGSCGGFGTGICGGFGNGILDRITGRKGQQERSRSVSVKSGSIREEKIPNPKLRQGERLMYPKTEYLTENLMGKPLQEIDSEFYSDTFVVVNSRFTITRFHVSKVWLVGWRWLLFLWWLLL